MDVLLDRQSNEQPTCHYPQYFHDDDTFGDEEEKKLAPEIYLKNKTVRRLNGLLLELGSKVNERLSNGGRAPGDEDRCYTEDAESANEEEDD